MTDGKQSKAKAAFQWTTLGVAAVALAGAATNYLDAKTVALKTATEQAMILAQLEVNYATMKKAIEGLEGGAKETRDGLQAVREAMAEIRGVMSTLGARRDSLRRFGEHMDKIEAKAEAPEAAATPRMPEAMPAPAPERVQQLLEESQMK